MNRRETLDQITQEFLDWFENPDAEARQAAAEWAQRSMQPGGGLVRIKRQKLGLTPGEAAQQAGLDVGRWFQIEEGEDFDSRDITFVEGMAVCDVLKIAPAALLKEREAMAV